MAILVQFPRHLAARSVAYIDMAIATLVWVTIAGLGTFCIYAGIKIVVKICRMF